MVVTLRAVLGGLLIGALAAGCGVRPATAPGREAPPIVAMDASGAAVDLRAAATHATATVITFFSAHCPCQRVHDDRLRAMFADFAPRGVAFYAIDAEHGASADRAAREATARRYSYPLLFDASGVTADAVGASYATFTVVLDNEGRVRYAGGIDSDRSHLTEHPRTFLRDALDDLTLGREVRVPEAKVLGCALER